MYADEGLVAEISPSGTVTKSYGWKPGSTWGTDPLFMTEDSDADGDLDYYFYHNDHLGTPQKMTNSNGAIAWSAAYNSFGKAHVDSGSTVTNNLRFPGQYEDQETWLYYNFHRYYDPNLGRYMRTDPIAKEDSLDVKHILDALNMPEKLHYYIYSLQNPLSYTDPKGLACGPGWIGDLLIRDYWFTNCCQKHDDCYQGEGEYCSKSRNECDKDFCDCMDDECDKVNKYEKSFCKSKAKEYCNGAKSWGNWRYKKYRCCK
jgi:RHS repeat-associated protein